jgi:hypothetical protein
MASDFPVHAILGTVKSSIYSNLSDATYRTIHVTLVSNSGLNDIIQIWLWLVDDKNKSWPRIPLGMYLCGGGVFVNDKPMTVKPGYSIDARASVPNAVYVSVEADKIIL